MHVNSCLFLQNSLGLDPFPANGINDPDAHSSMGRQTLTLDWSASISVLARIEGNGTV